MKNPKFEPGNLVRVTFDHGPRKKGAYLAEVTDAPHPNSFPIYHVRYLKQLSGHKPAYIDPQNSNRAIVLSDAVKQLRAGDAALILAQ